MRDRSPFRRRVLIPILSIAPLLFTAPFASANIAKYIGTSGTASGAGVCSITIESFGSEPHMLLPPVFNINVNIPNGSTATNSALLIESDVDAALPSEYTVALTGDKTKVRIFRSFGTFTMSISENVPTQTIQEIPAPVPGLPPWGAAFLALLLLGSGWRVMARRRDPA